MKYKQNYAITVLILTSLGLSNTANADLQSFTDSSDSYCGFKNNKGQIVVPPKYEFCGKFSDNMAYVGKSVPNPELAKYYTGYINETGKLVIPVVHQTEISYPSIVFRDFHEGVVAVYKDGQYGYMNKVGKVVIPYQYQTAGDFNKGRAVVCKDEKCGVIDKAGKTIVPFKFNWLEDYSDGMAVFITEVWGQGKSGFIDSKGNIVIKAKWDAVMPFSEGLAAVKIGDYQNGKWGIINKSGQLVVSPTYDQAYIEPEVDAMEIEGGIYKDGSIEMYDINDDYTRITRYIINKHGKVIDKKYYSEWYEINKELHPEYYQ